MDFTETAAFRDPVYDEKTTVLKLSETLRTHKSRSELFQAFTLGAERENPRVWKRLVGHENSPVLKLSDPEQAVPLSKHAEHSSVYFERFDVCLAPFDHEHATVVKLHEISWIRELTRETTEKRAIRRERCHTT